jgi:hypothetical protein
VIVRAHLCSLYVTRSHHFEEHREYFLELFSVDFEVFRRAMNLTMTRLCSVHLVEIHRRNIVRTIETSEPTQCCRC